ncbi:TetR/AcrR family transcriptional regulator [Dactylosporangium vinaceum]|uniref:TetR/AcrR family transcriptional regulator n=1 Tax=Dactylosporangium vinaceum TaxID=53362 RepID=A0ABV5MSW8_9ACTN|nr:TetR/AcrR family transcriptional regulator [Dactylosporangium vinaceum]UAB93371.1 TetR/AcrR family transcriptional regulator [Dactylosporangium vinaceum]
MNAETRRRRVPALAPDERRAALIAATLPLLMTHGATVTTRQIAEAAGVAEGTIFGVFPDKASLLAATLRHAFDPAPMLLALSAIDPAADLRQRLRDAAAIMIRRIEASIPLMMLVRTMQFPPDESPMAALMEGRRQLTAAVARLIEPDRHLLRRSPETAAGLLFALIGISTRGMLPDEDLTPDDIVAVLLDGLLTPPDPGEA